VNHLITHQRAFHVVRLGIFAQQHDILLQVINATVVMGTDLLLQSAKQSTNQVKSSSIPFY